MLEIIAVGKTVEEATENGIMELGLSRDEVSVEIIDLPVRKFFKTIPAKVKITANSVEAEKKEEVKPVKKVEEKVQNVKNVEKKEAVKAKEKLQPAEEEDVEIDINSNVAVKEAYDYLYSVFSATGVENIKITAFSQGDATLLHVEGDNIHDLIETKGEVVQALSYLCDRAVNKGVDKRDENYLRVRLDIAGYRNRRESELVAMAKRIGEEVKRTKLSKTLAPMNPYERLIVHTAISKMDGLKSESKGEDNLRRVVIKSTAPDAKDGPDWRPGAREGGSGGRQQGRGPRQSNNNKRSSGSRQGGRPNYNRPRNEGKTSTPEREFAGRDRNVNAKPVVPERREAIKDGDDIPLYGKIDI